MPAPDLVVLGRRVVTPDGVREAAVVVEDGRIRGIVARAAAPRRPGSWTRATAWSSPAWWTRTCTSTSPGARSGRASLPRPRPRPPAAPPPSWTCRSTASPPRPPSPPSSRSARPRATGCTWTAPSGAGSFPATPPSSRPLVDAGVCGLQVLPRALGSGRVRPRGRSRPAQRPCPSSPGAASPCWSTRSWRRPVAADGGDPHAYATYLASRPAVLGERRDPPHGPPVPRDRVRRAHRPPLVGRSAARARGGARRRPAPHRRDLPALPPFRRRGRARRAGPISSAARPSASAPTARGSGRPRARAPSTWWCPTTRPARPT